MEENKMKTIEESELYSLSAGIFILPSYRLALWSVKIEKFVDDFMDWLMEKN